MFYLIGIGLNDEKDISLKGLEAVRKCKYVYLDNYTSRINADIKSFEKLYGKKITLANRDFIEQTNTILDQASRSDICLLVIGDVFAATTHYSLLLECKKHKIPYEIIHNASIITAIGETGLDIYKFGRVASIPFNNESITTPIDIIKTNIINNMHTLVLLDLDPASNKFMSFHEAVNYLIRNGINKRKKILVCSQIGGKSEVFFSVMEKLLKKDLKRLPQSLVIPSDKLHFIEEESLRYFKI